MNLFNAIVHSLCAVIWVYIGYRDGFDFPAILVVALWATSGVLNTLAYIRMKKKEGKEHG